MAKPRLVLGITGNTGAGKSTVTRTLQSMGAVVLDFDQMTRELQAPGSELVQALGQTFGPEVLTGQILNRQALAGKVFSNAEALETLNAMVWPRLLKRTKDYLQQAKGCVVLDAPLLYEAGLDALCDTVWFVSAPEQVRCQRIMARDGLTLEQARQRMQSQGGEGKKKARADRVIDGAADKSSMQRQVRQWFTEIVGENNGKKKREP